LVRLEQNRRKVLIESAVELDEATRLRVVAGLSKYYGEGLNVTTKVNPELVGGLRIRVGDDVLDGSVQGRLRRLSEAF
jgi:F-type H+-transporting ATPase subunit delta